MTKAVKSLIELSCGNSQRPKVVNYSKASSQMFNKEIHIFFDQNDKSQTKKDLQRSSRPHVFCKEGVFKNFAKFTRKHLCQSLGPATLLKKRLWHKSFPVNFVKFLRTPIFTEHLRWLLDYHIQLQMIQWLTHQSPVLLSGGYRKATLGCNGLIPQVY